MESRRLSSKPQFEKQQTQNQTLQRSEAFYHDSLESRGTFVDQNTFNGTSTTNVTGVRSNRGTSRKGTPFHHDSLESRGTFVDQNIFSGTVIGCPPSSQPQLSEHGYPDLPQQSKCHFDSRSRYHVPKPWVAVADPSSGDTYYWNQETNEVQWEIPEAQSGLRSILKGSRKWRSERSSSCQVRLHKKVRFGFPEAEYDDDLESTSFARLETLWGSLLEFIQ